MNQLLVSQIEEVYGDSEEEEILNSKIAIQANQFQINKTLIGKMLEIKSEKQKIRKELHSLRLELEVEKSRSQGLQQRFGHQKQTWRQLREMEVKKLNCLIASLKSITSSPQQCSIETVLNQIEGTYKNISNPRNRNDRAEKLSIEVQNIILENFKTTKLLAKVQHLTETTNGGSRSECKPQSQLSNVDASRKDPILSKHSTVNAYIIPTLPDIPQLYLQVKPKIALQISSVAANIQPYAVQDSTQLELQGYITRYEVLKEKYQGRQKMIAEGEASQAYLEQRVQFLLKQMQELSLSMSASTTGLSLQQQKVQQYRLQSEQNQRLVQNSKGVIRSLRCQVQQRERDIQHLRKSISDSEQKLVHSEDKHRQMQLFFLRTSEEQQRRSEESAAKTRRLDNSIKFLQQKLKEGRQEKDALTSLLQETNRMLTLFKEPPKRQVESSQAQTLGQIVPNQQAVTLEKAVYDLMTQNGLLEGQVSELQRQLQIQRDRVNTDMVDKREVQTQIQPEALDQTHVQEAQVYQVQRESQPWLQEHRVELPPQLEINIQRVSDTGQQEQLEEEAFSDETHQIQTQPEQIYPLSEQCQWQQEREHPQSTIAIYKDPQPTELIPEETIPTPEDQSPLQQEQTQPVASATTSKSSVLMNLMDEMFNE